MKAFTALVLLCAPLVFAAQGDGDLPDRPDRIDRLEAGVRAQEAIRAVKRLQYTYGYYLEAGLWPELEALLTANAEGRFPSGEVRGAARIREQLMQEAGRKGAGLAEGQLHARLILQPIVTLGEDGKSARGTWHEVAMLGKFGASASWRGGIYENEYVQEHGVWKIHRVRYFEQYRGDYDDDGHKAPPSWGVPYHFVASDVGVTIPEKALETLASELARSREATADERKHISQLAARIRRLHDETEVQNLQHSFGYYLDRKMWDDVADLFTERGSMELAQTGVYVGRARIRQALEAMFGEPRLRHGELFDHIQMGTVVTVSADGHTARARTNELAMIGLNGEFARWELGTYENEMVREEGVWKLKSVRYFPRLVTDYDHGWARDAKPARTALRELPPDAKPTDRYRSYPKTSYVGFHYTNPVTGERVRYPSGRVASVPVLTTASPAALPPSSAEAVDEATDEALARLERRLDAAMAIDAVENLNSSYGYYLDESAWDAMADTFASTGSKEITGAGVYVGPDRIRKVLNLRGPRGGRTPGFFTIHQLTQPVIHVSEDGQRAWARLRLFQGGGGADGSTGSWIGGIYENTAHRENGEWKFGAQDLHHLFNASYRNGWARVGAAARANPPANRPARGRDVPGGGIRQGLGGAASPAQFAAEFPPDRPIRAKQYAFPEIVEPAFHYNNPVSGRAPPVRMPEGH